MKLTTIDTGFFKLDGGAMFGVVPKSIWQRYNPADDNNMCSWAMRCLLVEDGDRKILIDTGIGDKQDERFFGYFYLHGEDTLIRSLSRAGLDPEDITDVILTHLHFDHVGGAVKKDGDEFCLTFPNATYWSNEQHWEWAINPNPREKASFLTENIIPILDSGQLGFIEEGVSPFKNIKFYWVNGHTEGMMLPIISIDEKKVAFVADLLPSIGHLPIPYVMSYDTQPLLTLKEKEKFLKVALENDYLLFFEHDPKNECCSLEQTIKGIREKEVNALSALLTS